MLSNLVSFSITQRVLIIFAALGMGGMGLYNFIHLPIDAVPDITNVQVQINSDAPGFAPLEVEQRITFPIETALGGLPGLDYTRSISRYGLSQVTVVFKDGTDIYFARNLVNERVQQVRGQLPEGVDVEMGPISTGLGEIYFYTVESVPGATKPDGTPYTPTDLRTLHDWVVKPQLRTVPGVVEINAIGGYNKQYHILPNPEKLTAFGLSLNDLMMAVNRNNSNVGAGYIERNGEQYLVRSPGQVGGIEDLLNIPVGSHQGIPIQIKDVAEVAIGHELRTGGGTYNGKEVVLATAVMLLGENSRAVSKRVDDRLKEVRKTLPEGIMIRTVYDRTNLVNKTIRTVETNLMEGAILVIVILFLFLGNFRAALIAAMMIPLSMLFAITGMAQYKISANLMSLGAIDFGIIIDGAIIVVENCLRLLAMEQHRLGRLLTLEERFKTVHKATIQVIVPSLFGSFIIMVVYLPILTLSGVEGKMFTPMALTVVMALIGAMILSVTFVPAAVAIFIKGKVSEKDNIVVRSARTLYEPILKSALANPSIVLTATLIILGLSGLLATKLGTEFVPKLDEGDVAVQALRGPGTSLTESLKMQSMLEKRLIQIPEVKEAFARTGTAEVATDPMPPSISDGYIMLKPRTEWPDPKREKADLVKEIQKAALEIPGSNYEISQPIQLRFNELIAGVRADIGVKIFGDDLEKLLAYANKVAAALRQVRGAADVRVERVSGLPFLTITLDRMALARFGLSVSDVQDNIEIAVGGKPAGKLFDGDKRFDIVVRLPEHLRTNLEAIKTLPIPLQPKEDAQDTSVGAAFLTRTSGKLMPRFIQLADVAKITMAPGPNQISRENSKRRIVVSANVRDRDLGGFVKEAQTLIGQKIDLPSGYWISWGGQFEQLISASKTLVMVVPVALALIFLLLYTSLGSFKDTMIVFSGVPLALTGGVVALALRDISLSISAGIGFIALSGVAVLNGLVIISFINNLRNENGLGVEEALFQGAMQRMRPVLMTALVASLGFVPMALATGAGAEAQRPLATVVIGGIISSTLLTLLVLPVLYRLAHIREKKPVTAS